MFIVAKFADIPAVKLRTDFRRSGDYHRDPWNLMLSDYPRTIQVIVRGMELYQSEHVGVESDEAARNAIDRVAEKVIDA